MPTTIDRTTIISGPALITYDGQTFYSKGDITVTFPMSWMEVATSAFGRINQRHRDRRAVVSFEPDGRMTTALAAILWPYAATAMGASIYGATDKPMVIHGRDAKKLTLTNAAVTQMPTLRFAAGATMIGPVQFTGLIEKSGDPSEQESYYFMESAAYPGDTGYNPATIYVNGASAAWSSLDMASEAGTEIRFSLRLTEQAVDGFGTVDMRLAGVECTAALVPSGIAAESLLVKLAGEVYAGAVPTVSNMVITPLAGAGPPTVTLYSAYLTEMQTRYGTPNRIGQCTWAASKTFTQYSLGPPEVPFAVNPLWAIAFPS